MSGRNQWVAADYYIGSVETPSMFVAGGGTAPTSGIYPDQGTSAGRRIYFKSGGSSQHSSIQWITAANLFKWQIFSSTAVPQYQSALDVVDPAGGALTPDLVDSWVPVSGSAPGPTVTPFSTAFRDFDISTLANRGTKRYTSAGVRTTHGTGKFFFFFDSSKWPMLVVANHPMPEAQTFYYRRGLFVPSGSVYYRQRWKNPPALINIAAWAVDTIYAAGALIKYSGAPYSSRVDGNLGNIPSYTGLNSNRYWKRVDVATWETASGVFPGQILGNWDHARYTRYLKPTIQRVSCTANVPIAIGLPPVGEVWLISDDQNDFPIEYPYEVSPADEMALRAVLSGIGGLDKIKTAAMTDANLIAAISRFAAATPASATARVLYGGSPRSLITGGFVGNGSNFRRTLRQVGGSDQ